MLFGHKSRKIAENDLGNDLSVCHVVHSLLADARVWQELRQIVRNLYVFSLHCFPVSQKDSLGFSYCFKEMWIKQLPTLI